MIFDPGTTIYKSPGALPANHPVPNGQTSLPRFRNDVSTFCYKDEDGLDYRLVPWIEYYSDPETIINASTIPFSLPNIITNPKTQVRSLSCAVVNRVAQHGYSPGEIVIPVRGAAIELRDNEIWANIANNGVGIVSKNNTRNEVSCNVASWQLFLFGIFYIPQVP